MTERRKDVRYALISLVVLVAACGDLSGVDREADEIDSNTTPPVDSTVDPLDRFETVPSELPAAPTIDETVEEPLERAFGLAETVSDSDRSDMTVIRAERVEWNDGSLGCPEPGQMYTQAILPGYWIEIAVGDKMLDIRMSENGEPKLCETPLGGSRSDT